MKLLKEFLFLALLSGILGIAVALPFLTLFEISAVEYIAKSFLCGSVIGVLIKSTFIFFFRNVLNKTFLSFLIVIATISVFTYGASYIMGLRNTFYAIIMVLLADCVGVAANISIYRFTLKINQRLQETQQEIREIHLTEKLDSK